MKHRRGQAAQRQAAGVVAGTRAHWRLSVGACAVMAMILAGCAGVTSTADLPHGPEWAGTREWWTEPDQKPTAAPEESSETTAGEWAGEADWWLEGSAGPDSAEREAAMAGEWAGNREWWTVPSQSRPEVESRVLVEFVGNRSLSIGALTVAAGEALAVLDTAGPSAATADDAAYEMAVYYRAHGFHFVTVGFELFPGDGDEPTRCRFLVTEGPRVTVADMRFRGVSRFSPADLRAYFRSPMAPDIFVESRVRGAVDEIAELYRDAGHLRVAIGEPEIRLVRSPGRLPEALPDQALVTVTIDEGQLYRIDSLEFDGPNDGNRPAITALLADFIGQPYRRADHAQMAAAVRELYQEQGYYTVEVGIAPRIDDEVGAVTAVIVYRPGDVYTVGDVTFDTDSIDAEFLRGLIPLKGTAGQRYSISREREAYREILRTNLVKSLQFERRVTLERTLDYVIHVREIDSVEIRPHVGWGSYEGLRGYVYVAENNVFGIARIVSLTMGLSLRSEWIEAGWTDPFTLGGDWQYSLRGYYRRRVEPNFTRQDIGAILGFETPLSPEWTLGLAYEFRDTRSFDVLDPNEPSGFDDRLGGVQLQLRYNDAYPLLVPVSGGRFGFRIEHNNQVLGSTLEFTKFKIESSVYVPLDAEQRVILAFGYLLEFFLQGGDTRELPIQERIFNGGATSVRSFNEQGLRPFDTPTSTAGGQIRNVASVELRFPLVWNWGLDGAIFVDAGNLAVDFDTAFNHWRICVGVGVRYITPIGPARLDFGFNPFPRPFEDRWAVHFWIGFPY